MPPKRKAAAATAATATTGNAATTRPRRAAAQKTAAKQAAAAGAVSDDDDDTPPKKRAKKSKDADDTGNATKSDGDKKKMVTVVKRGQGVPVDFKSNRTMSHQVLEAQGDVWDATLNQTNVNRNNNKFYIIQLLKPNNSDMVELFTRWGRVGDDGQTQVKGPFNQTAGIAAFKKQFTAKTGVSWAQKEGMQPTSGKYMWIERDYDDTPTGSGSKDKEEGEEAEDEGPEPECTLDSEIMGLCKIIFSTKLLEATLSSMNYDANKAPLGKLAKSTILKGFETLKDLSQVLDDPNCAVARQFSNTREACALLTNRYYSIIPHSFGRRPPTIIDTKVLLKQELELVDALGDMQIASKLITMSHHTDSAGNRINTYNHYFNSLNLVSMEPIKKTTPEFQALERYTHGTHGRTHHFNCYVEAAFRIEREGEAARWLAKGHDKLAGGDRLLLWHGSRATNYAGILSQGLRIAPPEGVYFADMMSKSAGYTHYYISDNTALMLLCEVAVRPFHELFGSDYNADQICRANQKLSTKGIGRTQPTEWQDAGETLLHDELKGCHMPRGAASDVNPDGAYLQYNEYIVYDVSQIRLRYLLRIKMS